jgi:hypothetical protein
MPGEDNGRGSAAREPAPAGGAVKLFVRWLGEFLVRTGG